MTPSTLKASTTYATYRGVECPAVTGSDEWVTLLATETSNVPADFVTANGPPPYKQVTLDELERLETVTVYCPWREHNFQLSDIQGDEALVDYLDDDWTWTGVGRIERPEPGVATARLRLDELSDVRETRRDLLSWRREQVREARERGY